MCSSMSFDVFVVPKEKKKIRRVKGIHLCVDGFLYPLYGRADMYAKHVRFADVRYVFLSSLFNFHKDI